MHITEGEVALHQIVEELDFVFEVTGCRRIADSDRSQMLDELDGPLCRGAGLSIAAEGSQGARQHRFGAPGRPIVERRATAQSKTEGFACRVQCGCRTVLRQT